MRICVLAALLAVFGCKAKPAKPAGFVDDSRMKKDTELPFHRAWSKEGVDWSRYRRVHVAPVDTDHMLAQDWWKKAERDVRTDIAELALFTRTTLKEAFADAKENNRYSVAPSPDRRRGTVILELALVDVVPSKAAVEAIGWAMPFGTGAVLQLANQSTTTMEGRFRDAATGEVILSFADREGEAARPVDLGGFKWYSHAKGIIKDWAAQLVQVANRKPGEKVKDTKTFTLKPW